MFRFKKKKEEKEKEKKQSVVSVYKCLEMCV